MCSSSGASDDETAGMSTVCPAHLRLPFSEKALVSSHYAGLVVTRDSSSLSDPDRMAVDVSVVVVSWNVRELLRRCLESVATAAKARSVQIVVVDNASTDGSVDLVRNEFQDA